MSFEKEIRELIDALDIREGDFLGEIVMIAEVHRPDSPGQSGIVTSTTDDCTFIQQVGLIETAKNRLLYPERFGDLPDE